MAVQFYLFPRPLKSGEYPISVSAYVSNTRLQTTIGISISPDYWLDAKQCVRKGQWKSQFTVISIAFLIDKPYF